MKLVVPLTIPCTRSMCAAASVSWITRMTGTTPPTAASKRSCAPASRAASKISSPCWREHLLVRRDDVLAGRRARAGCSRAPARCRRSAPRSGRCAGGCRRSRRASASARPRSPGAAGRRLDRVRALFQQRVQRAAHHLFAGGVIGQASHHQPARQRVDIGRGQQVAQRFGAAGSFQIRHTELVLPAASVAVIV